jgi:hypothetical protein
MTCKTFARGFILTLWAASSAAMLAQSGSFTYDRAAETTVTGTILHLFPVPAPDGAVGVHFDLKAPSGLINVHVAPATYIGLKNFWFQADDEIEIIGAPAFQDGNKSFIARVIKKDGKTLTLRSEDGKPKWMPAVDGTDGCGVAHPALPRGTEL